VRSHLAATVLLVGCFTLLDAQLLLLLRLIVRSLHSLLACLGRLACFAGCRAAACCSSVITIIKL
jgi:hypothetical protein